MAILSQKTDSTIECFVIEEILWQKTLIKLNLKVIRNKINLINSIILPVIHLWLFVWLFEKLPIFSCLFIQKTCTCVSALTGDNYNGGWNAWAREKVYIVQYTLTTQPFLLQFKHLSWYKCKNVQGRRPKTASLNQL